MLETGLIFFFPFLMIYAAASDLFSMTIPNKVSLALIAGFLVFAVWMGFSLETMLWHWAAFGIVLAGGFALFAIGQMGAGDVKLAATTALWLGWGLTFEYLVYASLVGAVLTLVFVYARSSYVPAFAGKIDWVVRLYNHKKVPYGIALGTAALMVYPSTVWMQHVMKASLVQ